MSSLLTTQALELLQRLIAVPSFSREEGPTAALIADFLHSQHIPFQQHGYNVWAINAHFDPTRPTLLLNSHHDTVRPNGAYTRSPFEASLSEGKLFGLGSNDAGGALVSLIATFCHFYAQPALRYNLLLAATAEEEISGSGGIESLLPLLPPLELAIVGEPTGMQMAVAEKGLLVVDALAQGRAGHAAREEGENAIYKALRDIDWIQGYRFAEVSPYLGAVKMSVTIIEAGSQHNVVPDRCTFTIDIRLNECYTHEQVLDTLRQHLSSQISPRSLRLRPSSIPLTHPLVQAGLRLNLSTYGSPTTSDQALLPIPSLKIGPGDSARSHMADEFIYVQQIEEGIQTYIALLAQLL